MDDTNLYEFLVECELQHYYHDIKNKLKIQKASQLKYATNEDLLQIGMTRPELRRMHKFFEKKFPTRYLGKIKKFLTPQSSQNSNNYGTNIFSSKTSRRKVLTNDRSESNEYVDTAHEFVTNDQSIYDDDVTDSSDTKLIRNTAISGCMKLPESQVPSKHIIPADSIVINKELGFGEFGIVQQGAWTNNGERIQVAIKCLSKERLQRNTIEFLKEASIMHKIDHKHMVRLYGVVLDGNSLMLVTELAPLRSLLECLKEPALRSKFTLLTLCDFASQICDGMQYLESKRLIHRDLAARNILVFSRNLVKISDFGLSRALGQGKDYYQTNFNVNLKLPIAWCAPECISYLKFTSASDVWAYAVTLWEMFSYGFQPWAAMTGQQILQAIDEPNCQRLERPDCCPSDYYHMMLVCWNHDPNKRPKFADLFYSISHDCRPEQVQSTTNYEPTSSSTKMLALKVGDIITVIDKTSNAPFWKGVLDNGKSGLFDPNNIVSYLGKDLPNSKSFSTTSLFRSSGRFLRNELKFSSIGRRKLNRNMISLPKNDLKHTGHVGLDGAYFGDLGFLGGPSTQNEGVPKQIVAPYKPHEDVDFNMLKNTQKKTIDLSEGTDNQNTEITKTEQNIPHHYQEIKTDESDSEVEFDNDADDQTLVKTPEHRSFEGLDFGPSLISEMESVFKSLKLRPSSKIQYEEHKDFGSKSSGKQKKQATMKPITANDQKTLETFFTYTNEISKLSLEAGNKEPKSITPNSPTRRKFSFRLPSVISGSKSNTEELRNFSDEINAIPDIQSTVTEEAQLAYEELIEKSSPPISIRNMLNHRSKPPKTSKKDDVSSESPLKIIRSGTVPIVKPRFKSYDNVAKHSDLISFDYAPTIPPKSAKTRTLLNQANKGRHVRKYPLIMPTSTNIQRTLNKVTEKSNSNSQEDNLEFEANINQQLEILEKLVNDGSEENIELVLNTNLMYRREDNVSCEDLLNFANIKPSSRERGVDSDEVRIMSKVFRTMEISNEQCLEILEFTDWNVHKSIKLVKLRNMLNEVNLTFSLEKLNQVLDNVEWDLLKAFDYIKNNEESTVVHV